LNARSMRVLFVPRSLARACWYGAWSPGERFWILRPCPSHPVGTPPNSPNFAPDRPGSTITTQSKGRAGWSWRPYLASGTFVFAAGLARATRKAEVSVDEKTWTPLGEFKWTKLNQPRRSGWPAGGTALSRAAATSAQSLAGTEASEVCLFGILGGQPVGTYWRYDPARKPSEAPLVFQSPSVVASSRCLL